MSGMVGGGLGVAARGLFGSATAIFGGAKYWLIAMVVASVASGALGYYKGVDHVTTKVINASNAQLVSARAEGAVAQAKQDDLDQKSNKADYDKRISEAIKRNAALEALLKNKAILVPHIAVCLVQKAAMSKLNDADLIGSDAQ